MTDSTVVAVAAVTGLTTFGTISVWSFLRFARAATLAAAARTPQELVMLEREIARTKKISKSSEHPDSIYPLGL